jgi:hypothetical protein
MTYFIKPLLASFLTLLTLTVAAQKQQRIGCIEPGLRQQALEMKQGYIGQGFEVMRDAMISMDDRTPFPVIVELKKGVFYQIIFIGNARAAKLSLETYNSEDKRIDTRSVSVGKSATNYISFSFAPEENGPYVFSLMQNAKGKNICGSFTIMELKSQ